MSTEKQLHKELLQGKEEVNGATRALLEILQKHGFTDIAIAAVAKHPEIGGRIVPFAFASQEVFPEGDPVGIVSYSGDEVQPIALNAHIYAVFDTTYRRSCDERVFLEDLDDSD